MSGIRNFYLKWCREQGLKPNDPKLVKEVRDLDMWLSTNKSGPQTEFDPDLKALHEKFVQECIDFLRSRPDLMEKIAMRKKELSEEWGDGLVPDLRMYFGVDGLDESVEHGEWVSSTDSALSVHVGIEALWQSM